MPVVLPGREEMLAQALHSVLMQDYYDWELVIKDGDPENPIRNSRLVMNALSCVANERVSYAVGRDGGVFFGLNDCLKRATGEILYFMCSDDLLCPGAFSSVVEVFEQERFGSAYWLYGQTISADEHGRVQGVDGEYTTLEALLKNNQIGQPSVFWNRKMMQLVGAFDTRFKYAADYDMWIRMWKVREPYFLQRQLGVFRHHAGSGTQANQEATAKVAAQISWRHTMLGDLIHRARQEWLLRHFYGSEGMPTAHDDTPN